MNIDRLKVACDVLQHADGYEDVNCIAYINWKAMPEAAKETSSKIINDVRLTEYSLGNNRFVMISGIGLFQIM